MIIRAFAASHQTVLVNLEPVRADRKALHVAVILWEGLEVRQSYV
jgi:hypothetical protein